MFDNFYTVTGQRKNFKSNRVKSHERKFFRNVERCEVDPDSLMMDRIINNLRKEFGGKK
jgi:hypothetical protein